MKNWAIVIVVVFLLGFLGTFALRGRRVPVEAAAARDGPIREFVDERGKTRLPKTHLITMPQAGRIEPIDLVEGDPVRKGQVVAHLVETDLNNAVAEAQSAVDRLEAAIRENDDTTVETTTKEQSLQFVESMRHTVEAAKTRMTSGKARLDYAETNLGRIQRLFQTGAQTQDDVDVANLDYVEAQVAYRQDSLIWRSTASIMAATEMLPRMIQQFIDRKNLARVVLEKQRAEAQARLSQVLLDKQRGTMLSPIDGVVLTREVSNERQQPAGATLLEIGRLDALEIEADVLSQDVVRIDRGDPVEIYGPAIGQPLGAGVAGTVKRIYPAGFTKVSSLGVEQQRVKVIVAFAPDVLETLRAEHGLGVDFRVRTRIFTAEKPKALTVRRSALFRGPDNKWQTFVVRGGRARLEDVVVGLMNDTAAEIIDGVQAGEWVVLTPESSLTDGQAVRIIESQRADDAGESAEPVSGDAAEPSQ